MKKAATKKNNKKPVKLANPVTGLANKIASFFVGDDEIHTAFNFDKATLRIYFDNQVRARAFAGVAVTDFELGKLSLHVDIMYLPNVNSPKYRKLVNVKKITDVKEKAEAINIAFRGCPSYAGYANATDPFGTEWYFILGDTMCCQFENDDAQNPWGLTSVLPEEIIKEIIDQQGLQVSTVSYH